MILRTIIQYCVLKVGNFSTSCFCALRTRTDVPPYVPPFRPSPNCGGLVFHCHAVVSSFLNTHRFKKGRISAVTTRNYPNRCVFSILCILFKVFLVFFRIFLCTCDDFFFWNLFFLFFSVFPRIISFSLWAQILLVGNYGPEFQNVGNYGPEFQNVGNCGPVACFGHMWAILALWTTISGPLEPFPT